MQLHNCLLFWKTSFGGGIGGGTAYCYPYSFKLGPQQRISLSKLILIVLPEQVDTRDLPFSVKQISADNPKHFWL